MIAFKQFTIIAYVIVGAFTTHRDAPGGPMAYVTNVSSVSNLLRSSLYVLQTLLGDICLVGNITVTLSLIAPLTMILFFFSQIYRCSVVWLHNIWIIILPIMIWISCAGKWAILWVHNKRWRTCPNLVTGVGTIISFSKVSPEAQVFSIEGWVTAFFAATLSTNVICTCTSSYWYPTPFLTLLLRIQLWSRTVSGLLNGPVGSAVIRRARSCLC